VSRDIAETVDGAPWDVGVSRGKLRRQMTSRVSERLQPPQHGIPNHRFAEERVLTIGRVSGNEGNTLGDVLEQLLVPLPIAHSSTAS